MIEIATFGTFHPTRPLCDFPNYATESKSPALLTESGSIQNNFAFATFFFEIRGVCLFRSVENSRENIFFSS
jgi:hypothetical protein